MNLLFVCSANRRRSQIAEYLYSNRRGIEVKSAGVAPFAETPVSDELLRWADVILCMESRHQQIIEEKFADAISDKVIDYLDIPNVFDLENPSLEELIIEKKDAHLCKIQGEFWTKKFLGLGPIIFRIAIL